MKQNKKRYQLSLSANKINENEDVNISQPFHINYTKSP